MSTAGNELPDLDNTDPPERDDWITDVDATIHNMMGDDGENDAINDWVHYVACTLGGQVGLRDLARLREFLYTRMYRHWKVNRTRSQARRILAEMFSLFMAEPDVLPTEWFIRSQNGDEAGRARVVCDYIAGMTDRFAIEEHRRLFHLDVWN